MSTAKNIPLLPWLWTVSKIVAVLAVAGGGFYWVRFAPVTVDRHAISAGEILVEVFGTGYLEAHTKATVSSKIPGRLTSVGVDQGDSVHAGQVLAHLDDLDLKHEVEIEAANVIAHKAGIDRLQADVAHVKATLDLALGVHSRAQKLRSTGAMSQEDFDKTVESLAIARANQSRADAALTEGKKQLIAVEKAWAFRQARLADATIKAPFPGIVTRRDRNAGDVVVPGSAIVAMVATEELWIAAWVDETQTAPLKKGQNTRIVFRSEPTRTYRGKLVRLGKETDRETRETRVDIAPEELPANWSVGQRAEVLIEVDRKDVSICLPHQLLTWNEGQPGVFVDCQGIAEWRVLRMGLRGRDSIEVIDGLDLNEVVLSPTLKNGSKLLRGQRVVQP